MKVFIAFDHAGYELKEKVKVFLASEGYEVEDCGAFAYDKDDDYPDVIRPCAEKVAATPGSFGIIGGGTGNGEAMVANRIQGARAAVFHGRTKAVASIDAQGSLGSDDGFDIVRLAREHNNANLLSIASRFLSFEDIQQAIRLFLDTSFSGEERHARRVAKF